MRVSRIHKDGECLWISNRYYKQLEPTLDTRRSTRSKGKVFVQVQGNPDKLCGSVISIVCSQLIVYASCISMKTVPRVPIMSPLYSSRRPRNSLMGFGSPGSQNHIFYPGNRIVYPTKRLLASTSSARCKKPFGTTISNNSTTQHQGFSTFYHTHMLRQSVSPPIQPWVPLCRFLMHRRWEMPSTHSRGHLIVPSSPRRPYVLGWDHQHALSWGLC